MCVVHIKEFMRVQTETQICTLAHQHTNTHTRTWLPCLHNSLPVQACLSPAWQSPVPRCRSCCCGHSCRLSAATPAPSCRSSTAVGVCGTSLCWQGPSQQQQIMCMPLPQSCMINYITPANTFDDTISGQHYQLMLLLSCSGRSRSWQDCCSVASSSPACADQLRSAESRRRQLTKYTFQQAVIQPLQHEAPLWLKPSGWRRKRLVTAKTGQRCCYCKDRTEVLGKPYYTVSRRC